MLRRRRSGAPIDRDPLQVMSALNELSHSLRRGFGPDTARHIATTTRQVLAARVVAVTVDHEVQATDGEPFDWCDAVQQHAMTVLERRRTAKPTVYEASIGRELAEVAVSVITADDVPIGTIHMIAEPDDELRINELRELTEIISSQLQLAELEQSRAYAAEAELRALRAQISPHFLHNSLTAIAGLVNTDPARARSLIATFAGFLRASFRTQTDLTTVAEELRLLEAYLELENARFGDRFAVRLNIAPEVLAVQLPFLTVQPLVENAIRHGLESRPGPGSLRIAAVDAGPEVAIVVEDDGVGIDPDLLERALRGDDSSSHVGILSVDTRLRNTFGPEYGLTIATGDKAGTRVTVRLPKYAPPRA